MLLRAGLLYGLSALSFLLFGVVVWQGLSLSARGEAHDILSRRYEALAKDYADLKVKEQSSDRRARVAEDSLSRIGAVNAHERKALEEARSELASALSAKAAAEMALELRSAASEAATAERDAATAELETLKAKVAKLESAAKLAREAPPKAAPQPAVAKRVEKPAPPPASRKPAAPVPTDEIVIDSDRPPANWNNETTVKTETGTAATGKAATAEAKAATPKPAAAPATLPEQQAAPEQKAAAVEAAPQPPAAAAPPAETGAVPEKRPRKKYTTEEGLDMYFPF